MQQRIAVINKQLQEHFNQDNEAGLHNLFDISHPSDLGAALEVMDPQIAVELFEKMDTRKKVEVLAEVTPGLAADFLRQTGDMEFVRYLGEMNPDDAADIFIILDEEEQGRLLPKIQDDDFRQNLIDLISYPSDTAGGIMTTEYLAVPETFTVQETIQAVRDKSEEVEIIYYVYTLNEAQRLSGAVSLRRLLKASPDTQVREIAQHDLIKVKVEDDQEKVAKLMDRYGLLAVPVIDYQDRMFGIITADDAVEIMERETTEDIYKQAGLSPYEELETERSMRLTDSTLWANITLRIPWLVIVCMGTLVAAYCVSFYEFYLDKFVELAFFMPVIAAMGGNVGAQSTTIFVRGLVLGHVDTRNFWKQLFGELYRTGLGIGTFFGIFLGLCIWSWQVYFRGQAALGYALEFSLAVGVSMFIAILAASANGFIIPWLVHRMGADPAAASNPLLTTVQDVVGIIIYFTCAAFFLTYF